MKKNVYLLLRSKTGTLGFLITVSIIAVALLAPFIAPNDPNKINASHLLKPPAWEEGGSSRFFLGTDNLGRDLFSRIIFGSRVSLLVGFFSVVVAGFIGCVLGLAAGFFGGIADSVVMRLSDAFLSIPRVLLSLVVLSVLSPGVLTLIFVIGVTNWVVYARLIRSEVLVIKQLDYIKAARITGCSGRRIIFRHILPNVFSSIIVVSTLSVAQTIILEASMSFLGLGIQPPTVSWGGILADGRNYLASNWWIATFPGIAITVSVIGIMFLGNWLRDVLDPKNQGIL
ncbi:ABC transporter permease [Aminivibrio sp.]|uniref:ABC transporter permease n=1 Tax=Aminivibrio sp. TaxID=1872489 RepID=UPI00345E931B